MRAVRRTTLGHSFAFDNTTVYPPTPYPLASISWYHHRLPTHLLTTKQVGAFTAASNITGLLVDADAVTALLHRYGALAFWDYATAAPYLKVGGDTHPLTHSPLHTRERTHAYPRMPPPLNNNRWT